jgi:hypothetical protein
MDLRSHLIQSLQMLGTWSVSVLRIRRHGDFLTFLVFRFYPQNHSVARADYMEPCIPYELTGAGRQGFWSGFHPINEVLSNVRFLEEITSLLLHLLTLLNTSLLLFQSS